MTSSLLQITISLSIVYCIYRFAAPPARKSVNPPCTDIVLSILNGEEHLQSFSQTSQYRAGGISTCGLASLNCVRIAFKEGSGESNGQLQALLAAETTDEIMLVTDKWSGSGHLEVGELLRLPVFAKSLKLLDTLYAQVEIPQLYTLLHQLENIAGIAAAIITRPPEIIVCLKIPSPENNAWTSPSSVFVVFDSHPRPSHPDGAGWIFNTSVSAVARSLHSLLSVDRRILDDSSMQWQAQLLSHFSGHIVVPQGIPGSTDPYVQEILWDSSFRILNLQAELEEVKSRSETLESMNNQRYEEEQDQLKGANRALEKRITESEQTNRDMAYQIEIMRQERSSHPSSTPTSTSMSSRLLSAVLGKQRENHARSNSSHRKSYAFTSGSAGPSDGNGDRTSTLRHKLISSSSRNTRGKGTGVQVNRLPSHSHSPSSSPHTLDPSLHRLTERLLQHQHDHVQVIRKQAENGLMEQEMLNLTPFAQATFTCGVCLEVKPEEDIARIDKCSHDFCRGCLQNYVLSKIEERRFPLMCPSCMGDKTHLDPGAVEIDLIQQMYIPPKEYEILEEMMLSQYSIPLHCSKCSQTAFVDRKDYQQHLIVYCPLPGCMHTWCKNCNQTIELDGPQHSCDGSNELESLMREQGWKACPGCKTNIQKTDGCNHMTCPSPGCNMHFCYRCGEAIIQSAYRRDVQDAISNHFRICQLIEDVPDEGVAP